jgi:hypothetical protein
MWTECLVIVMGRGPCKTVRAISRGRVVVGVDKSTGQQRGSSSGGGSLRGDSMNLALVEVVR